MTKKIMLLASVAVILIGSGAFYGGSLYGKSQSAFPNGFSGRNGTFPERNADGSMRSRDGQGQAAGSRDTNRGSQDSVFGEVLSKNDTSITVKTPNGGSRIVYVSDKTSVGVSDPAALANISAGQTIMASGTGSTEGALVAHMLQIYPTDQSVTNDAVSQN